MAKNQKTLENQYHMVVARCKDLEEQMRIRQKQWDQREVESKTTEKLMRELCEDILAKDSKEMVLGTDYSWSSIQINELIRKSKQSFTNYIASRTDFMQKLVDQLEERRLEIEGLKDQISVMQLSPVQDKSLNNLLHTPASKTDPHLLRWLHYSAFHYLSVC